MNRAFLAMIMAMVMGAVVCHADTPQSLHRRTVVNLLISKQGFPTAKQMLRTGKVRVTVRILTGLVTEKNHNPVIRLNALRALEYFPTKETENFLGSLLYDRYRPLMYKATAMRAMARAFGSRVYFELLPFLRDSEAQLREGAALALGEIDDPRVMANLSNHLTHEQELSVRIAIERGMKLIRERERRRVRERARKREEKISK